MNILNLDGHFFVEPLRKMGHTVLSMGQSPGKDVHLTKTISLAKLLAILDERNFKPDLVLWVDRCRPPSVIGIEALPAVTIGYSIDQYCNPWHAPYSAAFDLMLVAQKDYLTMFKEGNLGNELEWAPLFCNPNRDKDRKENRDIPASFVGTVDGSINSERKAFLNTFKKKHPLFVTEGDYVPIYNRSQLVLNQSAVGELNFRIFEAMACGAVVLTEETENGLTDLFTNGEDILLYPRGNAQAAASIAHAALANLDLGQLAENGKRNVLAAHSSTVRARHIIKRAEEIAAAGPSWRQQQTKVVQQTLSTAYNMLAVDEILPLTPDLRNFYATLGQKTFN